MISTADLDYALPSDRIAQEPARPRDSARLLVVGRRGDALDEHRFHQLPELLGPTDLLVVNDTRVIPARLRGRKSTGGRAEVLLLERLSENAWRALARHSGALREGIELHFGELRAVVELVGSDGECRLRLEPPAGVRLEDAIGAIGETPLPPYIRRTEPRKADLEDYQSVFARCPGAVAAPTASLHFTRELAARLKIAPLTLHVGPGTFRPIRAERLEDHVIDAERFELPPETAAAIARTKTLGGHVIAVGTTVVRALEASGAKPGSGETDLFVRPGHRFRVVDELITNFHLPRSSLLALSMAFGGVERIQRAYAHAIAAGFRFYSYGDAMWIR